MKTDFLVIGSGIAGLSFALKASRLGKVAIVTKDKAKESNTLYAQGGLAAVFAKDDNFKLHIRDTLRAGDGICSKKAVELLVRNAPKEIRWLEKIGVKFDKNHKLSLSKEAVHSRKRIVHAGDITGEKIEKSLLSNIRKNKNIELYENHFLIDLITDKKSCIGASVLDIKKNKTLGIFAKATVLATGGIGRLYANTCNPGIATGDGIAAAYRAGADLQDMEFVQFHPTGLFNSDPTFLISETLRGEGGFLTNKYGKRYMPRYHRGGDLAPRDVVSKFSVEEMKKTRSKCVYLDVTSLGPSYLKKRFPTIYRVCLKYKIDLTKKPIPVAPTAHYLCGGVRINLKAGTNVNGLYAIGEASCSGIHGADRLASNSLTDGLVFGAILAKNIKPIKSNKIITKPYSKLKITQKNIKTAIKLKKELKGIMWQNVGIIRNKKGLNAAHKSIKSIQKQADKIMEKGINKEILELRNMALLSEIITKSALARKESRGTHFLDENPERNDKKWMKHSLAKKGPILKFFK